MEFRQDDQMRIVEAVAAFPHQFDRIKIATIYLIYRLFVDMVALPIWQKVKSKKKEKNKKKKRQKKQHTDAEPSTLKTDYK